MRIVGEAVLCAQCTNKAEAVARAVQQQYEGRPPENGGGGLCAACTRSTTSQPQKGACQQNSTAPVGPSWHRLAVVPIPPADWGTRSTRSHTSVSAPNTRSLIFVDREVGPGVRPVLGQVSPEGAWGKAGLGSSRFLAGFFPAAQHRRGRGSRRSAARGGKKSPQKWYPVEATAVPLCCYCGALANHRVLRLNVGRVVLHLRGRSAGVVWGDLALRRFNDWRASAGACSGALPSCGAHSHQFTTPRARIDGKNRCTRRPM
jgi:hypothetical protein